MSFLSAIAAWINRGTAPDAPLPMAGAMIATPPVDLDHPAPSTSGTRGVRNFNPGNIDREDVVWQGMAADQSSDPRFIVFVSAEYGIRALTLILLQYQSAHNLKTVQGMISRWAPGSENDTAAYVAFVCGRMGVRPDTNIDIRDHVLCTSMVTAIIAQENANYAYPLDVVKAGIAMAGVT